MIQGHIHYQARRGVHNSRPVVDADARGFPVGADESVNGRFRDECLNLEWFRSRAEARVVIENWRRHYNAVRLYSSLKYLTPIEFSQHDEFNNQGAVPK